MPLSSSVSRGLGSSCMSWGTGSANRANTSKLSRIRSTMTVTQAMDHGNLSFRCSHLAAGHRITAKSAEIVTGMKMVCPRYSATATPRRARTLSPIRVAEVRFRFIRTVVLAVRVRARWTRPVSHHRGPERVVQQHGDRHRPARLRNGRTRPGHRENARLVHVANEFPVHRVDPNVNDRSARFDHVRGDKSRNPDGCNQDVRLASHAWQISR